MHILVDMDGVLCNWGKQYDKDLDNYYPKLAAQGIPKTANQKAFNLHEGMTETQSQVITKIMDRPGFYAELKPIAGAVDALHEMIEAGHEVSIVTSPWLTNPTCVQDKYDWVKRYLGAGWEDRVIITKDKTLVDGDILIDDKGEITGKGKSTWKHVLYDQPYNQYIGDAKPRIHDWAKWQQVVGAFDLFSRKSVFVDRPESKPGADDGQGTYTAAGHVKDISSYVQTLGIGKNDTASAKEAVAKLLGEVRQTSATGGQKGAKVQDYSLIPVLPLNLLAELYHNGASKYSSHNWRKGYSWSLSYAAAMRHLTAFWNGEDIDPEMGLPHVTCATFHLFALAQFMNDFPEYDDRFKK